MNDELEKEVKRLEKYNDTTILKLLHEEDIKEIERLNNIIKEVREYIEFNHKHFGIDEKDYIDVTGILQILNKVNNV